MSEYDVGRQRRDARILTLNPRYRSFAWEVASSLSVIPLLLLFVFAIVSGLASSVQADEFELAEKLYFSGEYQACLEDTEFAIDSGDQAERWCLLQIDCLMMTGQYAEAAQALDGALQANPTSIQLRWAGYEVRKHNNDLTGARELLTEFDELVQYRRWRYRDAWNQAVQGRFQLHKRLDAKEVMELFLTPASQKAPDHAVAFLAIGDLGLAKHDYELAEENFRKATEVEPDNPAGHLGLANAWRPSDFEKSSAAIAKTMELNPNYVPGLHYLVDDRMNSERYDEAIEYIERILKINPHDIKAWTYRSAVAHLQNDPDMEKQAREKAFEVNERNPEIDHLIGTKLSQRYRFAEGAKMQRRSLTYDASFLPAKIQLANDLLRLGNADEGWALADEVYQQDGYNVVAYNLVTLGNTVAKYTVLQQDGFIVRMQPEEAEIYGQLVLDLLVDAKKELCKKYDAKVAEPVFVEIFPRQQDFAIRTFGLPGGSGYLGVCFGRVITMNSPKSQVRLNSNWQAVLWHEYCHVVTLQKTQNRMPRWLSEGISVYEERQKDPSWGQVMTPAYRELILGGGLTPVSELSGAFVKPESGEALQFAYYESSLVVEYLIKQYGLDVLKRILDDLHMGMPINQSLNRYAGDVKLLDKEFAKFAEEKAQEMAATKDWTKPELKSDASLEQWQTWSNAHPDNIYGMKAVTAKLIKASRYDEADKLAEQILKLYPNDRGGDNGHFFQAMIAKSKGDQQSEFELLKKSARLQSTATDVYERLSELAFEQKDWQEAAAQSRRWLAVNPLIPGPHRVFAKAKQQAGELESATDSLRALTLMDPFDPAEAFYRYALALQASGKDEMARREVLKCLEEAPRFRKAHQLLLQLVEKEANGKGSKSKASNSNVDEPATDDAKQERKK